MNINKSKPENVPKPSFIILPVLEVLTPSNDSWFIETLILEASIKDKSIPSFCNFNSDNLFSILYSKDDMNDSDGDSSE